MATREQYEFFRSLYDEEARRYEALEARARLYLSVISIFIAALIVKATDVAQSAAVLGVPAWSFVIAALLLASALLFVVMGALIRTYEGITSPRDVIARLGKRPPTNEDFFDARIIDLSAATERNTAVNDRTARYLGIAGVLLAISMMFLIALLTFALVRPYRTEAPHAEEASQEQGKG